MTTVPCGLLVWKQTCDTWVRNTAGHPHVSIFIEPHQLILRSTVAPPNTDLLLIKSWTFTENLSTFAAFLSMSFWRMGAVCRRRFMRIGHRLAVVSYNSTQPLHFLLTSQSILLAFERNELGLGTQRLKKSSNSPRFKMWKSGSQHPAIALRYKIRCVLHLDVLLAIQEPG